MHFILPLQVLVADINIGYEDIVNTQVMKVLFLWLQQQQPSLLFPSKLG
jgi:hypothetical protein